MCHICRILDLNFDILRQYLCLICHGQSLLLRLEFFLYMALNQGRHRENLLKTFQVFGQKQARDGGEVFAQEGRFTALPRLITFPRQEKRSQ